MAVIRSQTFACEKWPRELKSFTALFLRVLKGNNNLRKRLNSILTPVMIHMAGFLQEGLAFFIGRVEQQARAVQVVHVERLALECSFLHTRARACLRADVGHHTWRRSWQAQFRHACIEVPESRQIHCKQKWFNKGLRAWNGYNGVKRKKNKWAKKTLHFNSFFHKRTKKIRLADVQNLWRQYLRIFKRKFNYFFTNGINECLFRKESRKLKLF